MEKLLGCNKSILDGTESKFMSEKTLDLPASYDYRPFMTKIQSQNGNRCVCFSTIAALDWRLNMKDGTYDFNGFNPDEIYDIRADKSGDNGMTFKEDLTYCRNHGVKFKKGTYKIDQFAMVGSIEMVKYALIENGVVLFAVPVYNTDREDFWNKDGDIQGGHAMCFVGYNKDGFILRNSWGENYGNKGYAILPYKDFSQVWEIWTLL